MGIEYCRRGTSNPNVWIAAIYASIFLPIAVLLIRASSLYLATTYALAAAAALSGPLILLIAIAFRRKIDARDGVYTESLWYCGWQLWQESYAAQDIQFIFMDGLYAHESSQPYAYKLFVRLKNGASLPSLVFSKLHDAESHVEKLNAALQLQRPDSQLGNATR